MPALPTASLRRVAAVQALLYQTGFWFIDSTQCHVIAANIEGQELVCALFAPKDAECNSHMGDVVKPMRAAASGTYIPQEDGVQSCSALFKWRCWLDTNAAVPARNFF